MDITNILTNVHEEIKILHKWLGCRTLEVAVISNVEYVNPFFTKKLYF